MTRWKRPASECGQGSTRPGDLPAVVGVGAAWLAGAAVADVCPGSVADEPELAVERMRPEVLPLRALPVVVHGVVGEAGGAVAERAPVRVRREPLEREGAAREEAGVAGRQQDFRPHASLAAAASSSPAALIPSGWYTSVKRMSSGSSSVTCLTVWRIPRYAM